LICRNGRLARPRPLVFRVLTTTPAPRPTREQLAALALEEKAAITAGYDIWTVAGIESIGVPPLRMTDGPNGARGAKNTLGSGDVRAVCVPTGTALAASFDTELLGRGHRAKRKIETRKSKDGTSKVEWKPTKEERKLPKFKKSD